MLTVHIGEGVKEIGSDAFANCKELTDVYCYAENVPNSFFPFYNSNVEYSTLYVPAASIENYKEAKYWKDFGTIKPIGESDVETKKCAAPTISYADGKLVYGCDTEGVHFSSTINSDDFNSFNTSEVSLVACYDIYVVAAKEGYIDSDVATAKLYWLPSSGNLEDTGITTLPMRGIAVQSASGVITISGLDTNEKVSFYGLDGKSLGSAKSIDGNVSFSAKQGSVVVAKIGKESVKIAVE